MFPSGHTSGSSEDFPEWTSHDGHITATGDTVIVRVRFDAVAQSVFNHLPAGETQPDFGLEVDLIQCLMSGDAFLPTISSVEVAPDDASYPVKDTLLSDSFTTKNLKRWY